jgi:gamma-glutamyltranspeptidase
MANKMDDLIAKYNAAGFTSGSLADRMMAFLRSKGGTGSLADMVKQKRTGGIVTDILDPTEVP